MTDPTRTHPRLFYVTAFFLAVTILSFLFFVHKIDAESKARSGQLQNAFCGVPGIPGLLPTILQAPIPAQTSSLGRHIVAGAKHAAEIIHCPGAK